MAIFQCSHVKDEALWPNSPIHRPWWPLSFWAMFSFLIVIDDGIWNGNRKYIGSFAPTAMEVLKSTEWQHDLDSRGRHPAKGAGLSTSGDTHAEGIWQSGWFKSLRRQSTVYVQWQNRTDGWRIQNDRYCIQFQLGSTARKVSAGLSYLRWQYGLDNMLW